MMRDVKLMKWGKWDMRV